MEQQHGPSAERAVEQLRAARGNPSGGTVQLDTARIQQGYSKDRWRNRLQAVPRHGHVVGPCHQGKARPQVADGRTASNTEGSCEYIE